MQMQQRQPMKQHVHSDLLGPCAYVFDAANTGSWRLFRPRVDFSSCVRCGTCANYCPANVIEIRKDTDLCVQIMWEYCKGCGICANECPKQCILMVPERSEK